MNYRAEAPVLLRLLRRRLSRQLDWLRQGRLPEALELYPVLAANLQALRDAGTGDGAASALEAQCARLTDEIHRHLAHEQRLLSREWVELQVEQELARLRQPVPGQPRTGTMGSPPVP